MRRQPGQPGGAGARAGPLAGPAGRAAQRRGYRCGLPRQHQAGLPGDPEWPDGLDQPGQARPYALWVHGHADLRFACLRSVSMVGSRAATGYGAHVAGEMAADLGERGWAVVSGGPYGIDVRAHEVGLP